MQAARRGSTNTAEHNRKSGEGVRRAWENGYIFSPRACAYCGEEFTPRSGPNIYCRPACKQRARYGGGVGLTKGTYEGLVALQFGACALCGAGEKGWGRGDRRLHVDHDHKTGEIRGLLCGDCNTALGRFGDDPKRLRAAIRYLKHPPARDLE